MAARRQFTDLLRPEDASVCEKTTSDQPPSDAASYRTAESGREDLFRFIDRNQLGLAARITTEFGERKITFADYTASGRALKGIEDFIRSQVLPLYANTHTTASTTGMQSTLFRAEARDIVRRGVCADNNLDAVLFTGTGCTGAVGKMLELLRGTSRWRRAIDSGVPPVILVGPYEHHSNLLPWRESGAQVLEIREAEEGGVALEHLEEQLIKHTKHTLVVGTFSAASNVTGILTDTVAVATVLHRHGALAFFDYATAGPYCKVDMNPSGEGVDVSLAFKDAVFLSPHKFVGGVCTPGVLAFKRHLLERGVALGAGSPPCLPGGGTVFYVSEWGHRYLENLEEREEGGTPDIVGAIRCGLAFRVKEALGPSVIMQRAQRHWADALSSLKDVAGLELLGKLDAPRLPIVSFNVRRGAQLLHHNFVAALLNDLFGIQVRAGCACAGPYAQRCMGVSRQLSRQLEAALLQGDELLRPGFVRFNLPYCARECQTQFVLDAVRFVADQGWKLLPLYTFLPATGEWRHRAAKRVALRHRRWLSHFTFRDGEMKLPTGPSEAGDEAETGEIEHAELTEDDMWGYLKAAAREVEEVEAAAKTGRAVGTGILATEKTLAAEGSGLSSPEAKRLRWFMLPCEAHEQMCNPGTQVPNNGSLVMQSISDEIESTADVVRDDYHSAFEHFARGELLELLRRQPQAAFSDVLAIAGEKWRQLTPAARESYTSESFQASPMPSSDFVSHKSSIGVGGVSSDVKRVSENKAPEGFKPSARLNGAQEPSSGAPAGLCMRKPSQSQNQTNRAANDATILPGIDKKRVQKAEKKLLHLCGKAILDFGMIKHGDRVLVGLSGGKDSLSLLHILLALQKKAPIHFEVGACTVDPQTPEYDPSVLIKYLASLGVPYFYESQGIIEQASCSMQKNSICSFCSRMKRGILYTVCAREGYSVLALGQHLDDQAESLLMSAFHNGQLRTMKAHYIAPEHGVRVVRPLNYCREQLTREYAQAAALPVISENCPGCFEAPKERARIKMVLAAQEQLHPDLHSKLLKAMLPLMALECADGEAPILDQLGNSKHTAEVAISRAAAEAAFPIVTPMSDSHSDSPPPRQIRPPRQMGGGKRVPVEAEETSRRPTVESPSQHKSCGELQIVASSGMLVAAALAGVVAGLLLPAIARASRG